MILIDGENIGWACAAAPGSNKLKSGTQLTGAMFGFMRTMRMIRQEYSGQMIVLWDGRSWRREVYPDYKGNRKVMTPDMAAIREAWNTQRVPVQVLLRQLGIAQITSENMEADDLAAKLAKLDKTDTILISGDKDWLQLVNEKTIWVDPIRDRKATIHSFEESPAKFATPWQFIQGKALMGDAGDNIKGVGGVGPVACKWIFDNYSAVQCLIDEAYLSKAAFESMPKKIRDFVEDPAKLSQYTLNLLLVWLNHPDVPAPKNLIKVLDARDEDALLDTFSEYAFTSIVSDFDRWINPFQTVT